MNQPSFVILSSSGDAITLNLDDFPRLHLPLWLVVEGSAESRPATLASASYVDLAHLRQTQSRAVKCKGQVSNKTRLSHASRASLLTLFPAYD